MSHNFDKMISSLKEWDIVLSDKQLQQFSDYYDLLVEWNSFMNLTAITDFEEVCKKHFLDSLSIVKAYDNSFLNNETLTLIDIGTGAGFPGIPIKIAFPSIRVTLLDSLNKRIRFLDTVINKLDLTNCQTYHGRAEDYAKENLLREKYDLCVSRAVASLSTLSEYCLPYVKVGGNFISYKSGKISEEALQAEKAIQILGGRVERQVEFILPNSDIYRNVYIIKKEKSTPKKYPRKAGLPGKEPL